MTLAILPIDASLRSESVATQKPRLSWLRGHPIVARAVSLRYFLGRDASADIRYVMFAVPSMIGSFVE